MDRGLRGTRVIGERVKDPQDCLRECVVRWMIGELRIQNWKEAYLRSDCLVNELDVLQIEEEEEMQEVVVDPELRGPDDASWT